MSEKRVTPRIQPYVAPCRVLSGERRIPGYLADLSVRGARVACDTVAPEVGAAVVLEVRFGRQVRHSRLAAEVKWAKPSETGHVFGLTFTSVTPQEQLILESVVDEFRRRAAQIA